jgi:tetratricopeptide (TPR) repeat protein
VEHALAHAFLSFSFHVLTYRLREQGRAEAIDHAHKAIAFGNDDPTALATAAFVIAFQEHDLATAFRLFDRALEISNSNVIALRWSSIILAWAGRAELAIDRAQQALRLSPFDSLNFSAYTGLSIAHFHLGRYREAADAARSALEINPGFSLHLALLAGALLRDGHVEEAKKTVERLLAAEPSFTIHVTAQIVGLVPDIITPFVASWREAGLPE